MDHQLDNPVQPDPPETKVDVDMEFSEPNLVFCLHCQVLISAESHTFHRMTNKHKENVRLSVHEDAYKGIDQVLAN